MKKKSAAQSAFFNPRALIGLLLVLAGLFLAMLSFGVAQAQKNRFTPAKPTDPLVPALFDCTKIHELGIDKQENFRAGAIMIACGQSQGGKTDPTTPLGAIVQAVKKVFSSEAPDAYGGTDVDLVTGPETAPNIVQSETYTMGNPDNPLQILSAYNDSRGRNASPINISGASYSTDGGTTFVRLTAAGGNSPFPGTEGDPVALYHKPSGTWLTVWLDTACGAQGLGGFKTTTPLVAASWTHFCVFSESSADRESGWADNNVGSPFFGRLYISWNDFAIGSGALMETFSTDGGATWHAPITVINAGFIRNTQITGDSANGNLYIAGMDEGGGGFPHNDINKMFRSTDGGLTWTNTYTGAAFPGPGVTAVGYFACMFSDIGGFWRHEGWGEPAAFNNVVNLVYAQHGTGADAGDVYAIRSTDMGVTFGAPFKLNSDVTTRPQWQPSLSVTNTGALLATWYDGREAATCTYGNPAVPCYRVWGRKSNDNGATWLPDDTFSDVVSPLPAQGDPGIQPTYAGDYDYGSALANLNLKSWVDGRVTIAGSAQQDAFTDHDVAGFSVSSTVPACGSIISTQPVDFVVNLSDPVNPATVQATDFTVNGTPANSFVLGGGNTQITFHFNSTPVITQGLQTMHIPAGAFNKASGGDPNLDFTCTFRWDATVLTVTTTVPAVGGTFSPPGPGSYQYDVNWNEAVNPASVATGDLTLSGVSGASVTGVTVLAGNLTTRFTLNITSIFSGTLTATIAAGAITDAFGNPNAAFSGNYQYTGNVCDSGLVQNGGFETGTFPPWTIDGTLNAPVVTNANPHSGTFSALAGNVSGTEPLGDSSFYQQFTVPAGGGTLSFWHWDFTTDSITFDWQDAYITNSSGTILATIFHQCLGGNTWINQQVDMAPYAGQTVRIKFLVHQDGFGDDTAMYVDDVALFAVCPSAPVPNSAVSRMVHGAAGPFDINLPLVPIGGAVGIEDRQGVAGAYQEVITFATNVTVASVSVTSGTGSATLSVAGAVVTVNLTGVTNAQRLGVTLNNVNDGTHTGNVLIAMGLLAGDTNASGGVSAADVAQTKAVSGQTTTGTNFREDVNASGSINAGDVALVKSKAGTVLPP